MAKKGLTEEQVIVKTQEAELTRRRCMLMAAATGATQTGFSDALINSYWEQNFAGGPLDDLLNKQLNGS